MYVCVCECVGHQYTISTVRDEHTHLKKIHCHRKQLQFYSVVVSICLMIGGACTRVMISEILDNFEMDFIHSGDISLFNMKKKFIYIYIYIYIYISQKDLKKSC